MRILLVEDDDMIADAITLALRDHAYAVDRVMDGEAVATTLRATDYQAVLLDLGLPGIGGLEVLRRLRLARQSLPVIVITARDAVEARIAGLDDGADDYLVKPFHLDELLARLRAVIRRHGGQPSPLLDNGVISLDPVTREACRGTLKVILSAREFALLQALLLHPGYVLSRHELEERLYGWNEEIESNAIDFLIHGVRRKLGADSIRNIRGVGWCVERP